MEGQLLVPHLNTGLGLLPLATKARALELRISDAPSGCFDKVFIRPHQESIVKTKGRLNFNHLFSKHHVLP